MKIAALLIALLLILLGCASKSPRCERRLTPINAPLRAGALARAVRP
jgi:hypothetical protein